MRYLITFSTSTHFLVQNSSLWFPATEALLKLVHPSFNIHIQSNANRLECCKQNTKQEKNKVQRTRCTSTSLNENKGLLNHTGIQNWVNNNGNDEKRKFSSLFLQFFHFLLSFATSQLCELEQISLIFFNYYPTISRANLTLPFHVPKKKRSSC